MLHPNYKKLELELEELEDDELEPEKRDRFNNAQRRERKRLNKQAKAARRINKIRRRR